MLQHLFGTKLKYTIYYVGALSRLDYLVGGHVIVSRSDYFSSRSHYFNQTNYFSAIKQKYIVYVGGLSRSQANTDDRQGDSTNQQC